MEYDRLGVNRLLINCNSILDSDYIHQSILNRPLINS
uniref:Uncharacterized protein n=1 Tax=viral metagenome TaxID=1070528 RepID=A0A6C0BLS5_9ZZZZ